MEHLILFYTGTKNKPQRKAGWVKWAEFEPIVSCCHKCITANYDRYFYRQWILSRTPGVSRCYRRLKCTFSASPLRAGLWASLCNLWKVVVKIFQMKAWALKLLLTGKDSMRWKLVVGSISYWHFPFLSLAGKVQSYTSNNNHYDHICNFLTLCIYNLHGSTDGVQDARQVWSSCDADLVSVLVNSVEVSAIWSAISAFTVLKNTAKSLLTSSASNVSRCYNL